FLGQKNRKYDASADDYNRDRYHFSFCFFFSSRRRHTRSVSAFLLNRSSDLKLTRWMRRSGLICLARSSRTGLDMSHILFMVEILLLTFYKSVDYYLSPMLFNH